MRIPVSQRRKSCLSYWSLAVAAVGCLLLAPFGSGLPLAGACADEIDAGLEESKIPRIVKTVPDIAASGIDPELRQLSVTFDRDMQAGMSWTGAPPLFPPIDKTRQPRWIDARTCELPVKLEPGSYYRVGINSKNFQNFKSKEGEPARPATIYFTTNGAPAEVEQRLVPPKIVALDPPNGGLGVDPNKAELQVTFDVPMSDGMSWTGGGETFPTLPPGTKGSWSADRKTCTLPVILEPGRQYRLGLNSASHINFQSEWGVPLVPAEYTFTTAGP